MARIGSLPCSAPKVPTSGLRSNASASVCELWALTMVAPILTKSPTCAVARPPIILVALVETLGWRSGVVPRIASLARENNSVASYLSAAKSIWMPLKRGLEKVSGVRAVRMRSPMVIAR